MSTITQNIHKDQDGVTSNLNMILRALMVMGFLTILLACNLLQNPEMEFRINSNLLGLHEQNTGLKIDYQVPFGFTKVSETSFPQHYQNMLGQHGENIIISAIYQDTTSASFMILSKVSEKRWMQYNDYTDNTLASPLTLEWNYVNATTFKYNKFDVQQWLLQDIEWVNFRLLFNKNNSFFQVDYLIPTVKYDQEVARIIESSIGSFQSN